MLGVVRTCAIRVASKIGKTDNKRITVVHQLNRLLRKPFMLNNLPRMDSNHDKVIQSHLCRCSLLFQTVCYCSVLSNGSQQVAIIFKEHVGTV
jgi:hypothetical protein